MNPSHFAKLESLYLGANINRRSFPGTEISISEGEATVGWTVSADFFHGMEATHGSVYFKLLDDACFFAVNSLVTEVFVLTTSFDVDFLRPVSSGRIEAVGHVVHSSRNLWVARGELSDAEGRILASGTGRFVKSRVDL